MLTKFYRIDEAVAPKKAAPLAVQPKITEDDIEKIAEEIIASVNATNHIEASRGWIAGLTQQLTTDNSAANVMIRKLGYNTLKTEEEIKDAINHKIAFDIFVKYGLAVKTGNGYKLSSSTQSKEIISRMRQVLGNENAFTKKPEAEKNQYNLRTQDQIVNNNAEQQLRTMDGGKFNEAVSLLVNMEAEGYRALNYLINVRQYARETKTNYSHFFMQNIEEEKKLSTLLHTHNLINQKGLINNKLLDSYIELFKKEPDIAFKLNKNAKSLYDMLEELSAEQTYVDNDNIRRLIGTKAERVAIKLLPTLDEKTLEAIKNYQVFPEKFQKLGLVNKNGETTDVYTVIQILLKTGFPDLEQALARIVGATGKQYDKYQLGANPDVETLDHEPIDKPTDNVARRPVGFRADDPTGSLAKPGIKVRDMHRRSKAYANMVANSGGIKTEGFMSFLKKQKS